jgi:hypothetical protein
MQSFVIGMVLAGALIGGLLLVYETLAGDDSPGDSGTQSQPTRTPTAGLVLGAATSTPALAVTPSPAGSTTPGPSPTPGGPTPTPGGPTPTGTPATAAQPNRRDCALIAGTDYLSEAERDFYIANCGTADAPTTAPAGVPVVPTVAPAVPRAPPTPTLPPRNPIQVAFEGLIGSTIAESDELTARLSAPRAVDSAWRSATSANIMEVQRLVGVGSITPPPECLLRPYAAMRSAAIELSIGAGLAASGLDANDINLMRLASQRLSTGRAGLAAVLIDVSAADC